MKFYYSEINKKITIKAENYIFLSMISFTSYSKLAEELLRMPLKKLVTSLFFWARWGLKAVFSLVGVVYEVLILSGSFWSLLSYIPLLSYLQSGSSSPVLTLTSAQCLVRTGSKGWQGRRREGGRSKRKREFKTKLASS